ncbi:hypothetical protein SAMN05428642_10363 [Flaviramulus basaltis]|uniref:LexA-binding, inner membrane-associated hydrolase n=1 Tax=Flaviramulus basaltis TaxID=369401 RepID=A0A1K2ILI9_9FLAO|nr:DUF6122 family protein [Flaviramulus basaltis]SFZ93316.1 hypothetical protein SAMN05428642_10363 [Flaviramulus basaltis]
MLQTLAHYGCHIFIPLIVALIWYKPKWKVAFLIMLSGMLIDLDHLLANPIFDPNRCSIGFHPLHSSFAITFYLFLLFPKKSRLLALGLVIHIIADLVDCALM